jgi:hypothetical protein
MSILLTWLCCCSILTANPKSATWETQKHTLEPDSALMPDASNQATQDHQQDLYTGHVGLLLPLVSNRRTTACTGDIGQSWIALAVYN